MIPLLIWCAIIFFIWHFSRKNKKLKSDLLNEYNYALQSGNKAKALVAGRLYYESTRSRFWGLKKGRLTIYDEQAITNDISTMK